MLAQDLFRGFGGWINIYVFTIVQSGESNQVYVARFQPRL